MIETEESRKAWQKEHEEAKQKLKNIKLPGLQKASSEPQVKPERTKPKKDRPKKTT